MELLSQKVMGTMRKMQKLQKNSYQNAIHLLPKKKQPLDTRG